MSGAQWFVVFMAVIVGCLAVTALSYRAEQYLRGIYRSQRVAWDDDELARMVAVEEAEVDEWLRLARVVGVLNPGTPIYDRLVCEQIEQQEGWVA